MMTGEEHAVKALLQDTSQILETKAEKSNSVAVI
jgi:hypothetical protein